MPQRKEAILRAKREQPEWFSRGQYHYDTNTNLGILYGIQTVATWWIWLWLNHPCVAAMLPHVNLLWWLIIITNNKQKMACKATCNSYISFVYKLYQTILHFCYKITVDTTFSMLINKNQETCIISSYTTWARLFLVLCISVVISFNGVELCCKNDNECVVASMLPGLLSVL